MSNTPGGMEEQLVALYAEREMLASELGALTPTRSSTWSGTSKPSCTASTACTGRARPRRPRDAQLLAQVKEIDQTLADAFSEKTVTLEIENDRPVLRATWRQTTQNGDRQ